MVLKDMNVNGNGSMVTNVMQSGGSQLESML